MSDAGDDNFDDIDEEFDEDYDDAYDIEDDKNDVDGEIEAEVEVDAEVDIGEVDADIADDAADIDDNVDANEGIRKESIVLEDDGNDSNEGVGDGKSKDENKYFKTSFLSINTSKADKDKRYNALYIVDKIITGDSRRSSAKMTLAEFSSIVTTRIMHINNGSAPFVIPHKNASSEEIVLSELAKKKCPLMILRPVSRDTYELWRAKEMILPRIQNKFSNFN
jgi:hypothetical protein